MQTDNKPILPKDIPLFGILMRVVLSSMFQNHTYVFNWVEMWWLWRPNMIHILFIKPLICYSSLVPCTGASALVIFLHTLYSAFSFNLLLICVLVKALCKSQVNQKRRERTNKLTETILIGGSSDRKCHLNNAVQAPLRSAARSKISPRSISWLCSCPYRRPLCKIPC